jgi:hypothetical protein
MAAAGRESASSRPAGAAAAGGGRGVGDGRFFSARQCAVKPPSRRNNPQCRPIGPHLRRQRPPESGVVGIERQHLVGIVLGKRLRPCRGRRRHEPFLTAPSRRARERARILPIVDARCVRGKAIRRARERVPAVMQSAIAGHLTINHNLKR